MNITDKFSFTGSGVYKDLSLNKDHQKARDERVIQDKSWLRHPAPLVEDPLINSKLLALLAGDAFIGNTAFEGACFEETLAYFIRLTGALSAKIPADKQERFNRFIKGIKQAHQLAALMETKTREGLALAASGQDELINRFSQEVYDKFVKEGEGWFPGGWVSTSTGGHAIFLHIDLKGKVSVFNTGEGVNYHPTYRRTEKDPLTGEIVEYELSQQFVEIKDLNSARLNDVDFFKGLIELQLRSRWTGSVEAKPEHFYKGILTYLKGRIGEGLDPKQHPEMYKKNQRSGTCALKCLTTALYYTLEDRKLYKTLKFYGQLQALIAVVKNKLPEEGEVGLSKEEFSLIQAIVQNLARSSEKVERSREEVEALEATLLDIETRLTRAHLLSAASTAAPLNFSVVEKEQLPSIKLKVPEDYDEPVLHTVYSNGISKGLFSSSEAMEASSLPVFVTPIEPRQVKGSFQSCAELLASSFSKSWLNRGLIDWMSALPLPVRGRDSFWGEVPKEDIESILKSCDQIALSLNTKTHNRTPESMVLLHALLAIVDALARRFPEAELKGYEVYADDLLIDLKTNFFILPHPGLQKKLGEILHYFYGKETLELLTEGKTPVPENKIFYSDHHSYLGTYVSAEALKTNRTVQYYKKLLDKNRAHYLATGIISREMPWVEQLARLMAAGESILPKGVYQLQRLAGYAQMLRQRGDQWSNPFTVFKNANPKPTYEVTGGHIYHTAFYGKYDQTEYLTTYQKDLKHPHFPPSQNKVIAYSKPEKQAEAMLNTNPYETVKRVLQFVKEHRNDLSKPDVQKLLYYRLFDPGVLLYQLESSSDTTIKLAEMVHEGILHGLYTSNFSSARFFLSLGQELATFIRRAGYRADGFTSLRGQVYDKLWPHFKEESERLALLEVLVDEMADREEPKNRIEEWEVACDLLAWKMYSQKVKGEIPEKTGALRFEPLVQSLASTKGGELAQFMLDLINPLNTASPWKGSYPWLENEFYQIDLQSGHLTLKSGGTLGPIPAKYRERADLLEAYPRLSEKSVCKLITDGFILGERQVVFYKDRVWASFEGQRFQSIPLPEALKGPLPFLIDSETTCWMACHEKKEWFETSHPKDLLLRKKGKTVARVVLDNKFTIQKIYSEGKEWVPLSQLEPAWHEFKGEAWRDLNQPSISKLKLEGGLDFEIKGKINPKAYLKQQPGFYLIPKRYVSALPKETKYLTLENSQGSIKILVGLEGKWIDFMVGAEGELLAPRTQKQLFHLSLWATQKEYRKAGQVLEKLTPLKRFSQKEREVLAPLVQQLNKDYHPEGTALFLALIYKIVENNLKYPLSALQKEESPPLYDPEKVMMRYLAFLETRRNAPLNILKPEHEIELIKALPHEATLSRRLDYLKNQMAYLGLRRIYPQAPKKSMKALTTDDFKNLLRGFSSTVSFPFISEDSQLNHNYFAYYAIARGGSAAEKEKLRRYLDFHAHMEDSTSRQLRDSLHNVLNSWWWYPSIGTLQTLLQLSQGADSLGKRAASLLLETHLSRLISKSAWTIPSLPPLGDLLSQQYKRPASAPISATPLLISSSTLEEVDHAFDTYFYELAEGYFYINVVEAVEEKLALPLDPTKPLLKQKLESAQRDLEYYQKHQSKEWAVTEKNDPAHLAKDLRLKIEELQGVLKIQKEALLVQVNRVQEVDGRLKQRGRASYLDWQALQSLSLAGTQEAFQARTSLSSEEANRVMLGTLDYLVKETRLQQMKFVLGQVQNALKSPSRNLYLKRAALALTKGGRCYKPTAENRGKLWFEHASRYLYRQEQLEKINEVSRSGDVLAEMPTGFGKTATLIPTLNHEREHSSLIFNVWPSSLELINTRNTQEPMDRAFGKKIDRFIFERTTQFSLKTLHFFYEEMIRCKEQGKSIHLKSEAIRSLELHFLLTLHMSQERGGLDAEIIVFKKILSLIHEQGWASIDEAHVTLSPFDKLIYTLGDPESLPEAQVVFIETIFKHLADDPRLGQKERFKALAAELAEKLRGELDIPNEHLESYRNYVLGTLDEPPSWVVVHPKKSLIALLKGELNFILPSSLEGQVNENYGLSKQHIDTIEYAGPYSGSNTPKENKQNASQFKNPHETLNKTYLTYLTVGLSLNQIKKLFMGLKEEHVKNHSEGIPSTRCPALRTYKEILPESNIELNHLKEADLERLYSHLQHDRKLIFHYIKNRVARQIRIYPYALVSTAQNLRSMFKSTLSLSATPPDPATAGPETIFIPMLGTSGQVTHLLLTKCRDPKTIHVIDAAQPKDILDKTMRIMSQNPRIRALVDSGAQYRGMSNEEIAQTMRRSIVAQGSEVEGILFFDDEAKVFKVLEVSDGKVSSLENCEIDLDKRQAFYDQNRSFGTDLQLAIDTVALLLMGMNTTQATAGQGAGRLRQLHQGQSVEPVLTRAIAQKAFGDKEPTAMDLLLFLLNNQAEEEAKSNYESQLQQMDNEIRRPLLDKLLTAATAYETVTLFSENKEIFLSQETSDPFRLYGVIPQPQATDKVLEEYKAHAEGKVRALSLPESEKAKLLERLGTFPDRWRAISKPLTVMKHSFGLGMECETLQEVEVEAQIEAQVEAARNVQERAPNLWDEGLNIFSKGWEVPIKHHFFFLRLQRAIVGWGKRLLEINRALQAKIITHMSSDKLKDVSFSMLLTGGYVALVLGAAAFTIIGTFVALRVMEIAAIAFPKLTLLFGLLSAGAILREWYTRHKASKSPPVASLQEAIRTHISPQAALFFSPKLLVTNNFLAQNPLAVKETVQKPFEVDQKPLFEVLVIQDGSELKMILMDQHDSHFFHSKLKSSPSAHGRKIAIYDLSSGLITQGANQGENRFLSGELENNLQFKELLTQAKFYSGELNYSEEELHYLEKEARRLGINPLRSLFVDHILKHSPHRSRYSQKPIAKIFS